MYAHFSAPSIAQQFDWLRNSRPTFGFPLDLLKAAKDSQICLQPMGPELRDTMQESPTCVQKLQGIFAILRNLIRIHQGPFTNYVSISGELVGQPNVNLVKRPYLVKVLTSYWVKKLLKTANVICKRPLKHPNTTRYTFQE